MRLHHSLIAVALTTALIRCKPETDQSIGLAVDLAQAEEKQVRKAPKKTSFAEQRQRERMRKMEGRTRR